jgi:hypothetical protein
MPMLARPGCLELGEVPVALLIWDYSRAGATDSFTGILNAPNLRLGFAVSKAVGIPLEMRNVPYVSLLPMLARVLSNRPKPGCSLAKRVLWKVIWLNCPWYT